MNRRTRLYAFPGGVLETWDYFDPTREEDDRAEDGPEFQPSERPATQETDPAEDIDPRSVGGNGSAHQ